MSILVTGDLHGAKGIGRLTALSELVGDRLSKDDHLIVLGDFELPWHGPPDDRDERLLDTIESFPWSTSFIDGNHENFDALESYPVETWMGGSVHVLRDSVRHLMRGEVFRIDGESFLAMGGAESVNAQYLKEAGIWWERELPSEAELAKCLSAVEREGGAFDYVLTHCPPAREYTEFKAIYDTPYRPDAYSEWLEANIAAKCSYKMWFYGHMHDDRPWEARYVPLMHVVYDLHGDFAGTLWSPYEPLDYWAIGDSW